jgi:uncharacterized damage-inducible protein DinB
MRPPRARRSRVDEVALLRNWLEWLAVTRRDYLAAILRLSARERTKDRGASFGSIQDIYLHIVGNNIGWVEEFPADRYGTAPYLMGTPVSAARLRSLGRRIERADLHLARTLRARDLDRKHACSGDVNGRRFEFSTTFRTVLWHLLEEELQHRGELNALFWQLDLDAPTSSFFRSRLSGR